MSSVLEKHGVTPNTELPRGYLSFSQISKYIRCAKQYEYHYVHDGVRDSNAAMALGTATHAVMEWVHSEQLHGRHPSQEDMLQHAHSVVSEMYLTSPWGPEADDEFRGMVCGVQHCLNAWWYGFGRTCKPISTEQEIVKVFRGHNGERIPVLAYVDLKHWYGDEVEVLDYKTSARAKTQNFVNESLQLWLYSEMTGCDHVAIASLVRPSGSIGSITESSSAKFDIKRTRVSEADRQHARNIVADVYEGIEAGIFPRCLPDEWVCSEKWCNYFEQCRLGIEPATPPESAV